MVRLWFHDLQEIFRWELIWTAGMPVKHKYFAKSRNMRLSRWNNHVHFFKPMVPLHKVTHTSPQVLALTTFMSNSLDSFSHLWTIEPSVYSTKPTCNVNSSDYEHESSVFTVKNWDYQQFQETKLQIDFFSQVYTTPANNGRFWSWFWKTCKPYTQRSNQKRRIKPWTAARRCRLWTNSCGR